MPGPVSDQLPSLADRMRALPDHYPLSSRQIAELNLRADELDATASASDKDWSVKKMFGAWVRARLLYCEITGEDFV